MATIFPLDKWQHMSIGFEVSGVLIHLEFEKSRKLKLREVWMARREEKRHWAYPGLEPS
jgi:hypothetical protein